MVLIWPTAIISQSPFHPMGEKCILRLETTSRQLVALVGSAAADPKAQFKTAQQAQLYCPGDVVVWLNLSTGVYLMKGERWYGRGRHGAFVCKREADASGNRVAVKGG